MLVSRACLSLMAVSLLDIGREEGDLTFEPPLRCLFLLALRFLNHTYRERGGDRGWEGDRKRVGKIGWEGREKERWREAKREK